MNSVIYQMTKILLIFILSVVVSYAGENDSQNLTSKLKSEVDFSGYTENELDSLAYYCIGRGLITFNGYSKIEEKLYKVDIHPQTSKEGITTGYALLYGHYIKPPYKFEIINDTVLYLNGIQIDPPIKNKVEEIARAWYSKRAEEKVERLGLTPYLKHEEFLLMKADSIYKSLMPTKGQKAVIDSITNLFKNDTMLFRFGIGPLGSDEVTGTIISKRPDGDTTTKIGFTLEPNHPNKWSLLNPKNEEERMRWRKEMLEGYIKLNEDNLKKGGTQYGSGGRYSTNWALTTYQIMSDPSLDLFMKYERLMKIDPAPLFYKEIIYNYSPEEFQDIEKRKQK